VGEKEILLEIVKEEENIVSFILFILGLVILEIIQNPM
jgi:hypothetical protein